MNALLQNILNGISLGSIYALVALGYTMVYGVLQFINFAHSDIFMVGAFVGFYFWLWFSKYFVGHPILFLFLTMIGSQLACVMLGLFIERVAYRPLRKSSRLNVLITAIGASLLLENIGLLLFGADPKFFPSFIPTVNMLGSGQLMFNNIQLIVLCVSLSLMVILHRLIHHTRTGMAMRAVSYDIETANLMGIHSDKIIAVTFALGSALAGAASILYGLSYPKIEPLLGTIIGVKAFVAAVFGGIGNIMGAAVGGILLGLLETFVVYYVSSSLRDGIAFGILILVLLFRPSGLFGTTRKEKV